MVSELNKSERQALIQQIVSDEYIQRQEDLVAALEERGYEITQATISRDIKEMSLIKVPLDSGGYRYSMPQDTPYDVYHQLEKLFEQSFVSIDSQNDLILINTTPGSAEVLANVLQLQNFEEIFAVIENDNSVLIICRSVEAASDLRNQLLRYI